MAIEFKNVTDISTPQGNLIKIHETASGRVLWEKKDNSSPVMFVSYINNGTYYYSPPFTKDGMLLNFGSINRGSLSTINYTTPDLNPICYVGAPLKAVYCKSKKDFREFTQSYNRNLLLPVTDAEWVYGSLAYGASYGNHVFTKNTVLFKIYASEDGYDGIVRSMPNFVKLSSYQGSDVQISWIEGDFSSYISAFNNDSYVKANWPLASNIRNTPSRWQSFTGEIMFNIYSPSLGVTTTWGHAFAFRAYRDPSFEV